MIRRNSSLRLVPALTTLVALTAGQQASAHVPSPATCAQPLAPNLSLWPLWERPDDVTEFPADITLLGTPARTHIWNSFGEYQHGAPHYMHTGIDINADAQKHFGDWVVASAPGYIWGVHSFFQDSCTSSSFCKVYIRDATHRYVYYYSHLKMRDSDEKNMDVEFDSAMRARINQAAAFTGPDMDTNPMDDVNFTDDYQPVYAGEVIAGIGPFTGVGFAHLHFSVMDACENYDGLNPLDHVSPPGFVDDSPPVVNSLQLVNGLGSSDTVLQKCDDSGDSFDIVANANDIWRPDGTVVFQGNQRVGIDSATYRLTNLTAQDTPTPVVWYDSQNLSFRCPGPTIGADCPHVTGLLDLQQEFLDELSLEFPSTGEDTNAGPSFSHTFTNTLFSVTAPFASHSKDYVGFNPNNFAILNNEWGIDDGPIDPAGLSLDPGLYQVLAEVFDHRGLAAAKAQFFVVPGGTGSTANLLIRDNENDVGAIPSNTGGNKHWRSTSIKVGGAKPSPNAAVWGEVQVVDILAGVPTKVYVRVENQGCEAITDDWEVQVGTTKTALVSTDWVEIGSVTDSTDLDPGEAQVVELAWTPTVAEAGHRCLLAAVNTPDDPTKVPVVAGQMDFTQLDSPASQVVPLDSNLGQRNITISNNEAEPFMFGNPFGVEVDFGLEFDCNDVPIDDEDVSVVLKFDRGSALDSGWLNVPRTTLITSVTSPYTAVVFHGCKIEMPPVALPANTVLDAWVEFDLPVPYTGTWDIDLQAKIDGVRRDGITVRHAQ